MDYSVEWTEEAMGDLHEIALYIEKDSHVYASSVVTRILDVTNRLKLYPYSGRVVPEENDETVRECFVYSYREMYEIVDNRVLVLAVIHGKRNI